MSIAAKKYCISVGVALIAGLLLAGFVLAPQLAIADGSDISLPALIFPYAKCLLRISRATGSLPILHKSLIMSPIEMEGKSQSRAGTKQVWLNPNC
jgi:hypothetical protein